MSGKKPASASPEELVAENVPRNEMIISLSKGDILVQPDGTQRTVIYKAWRENNFGAYDAVVLVN
ncbi:hypothetical protein BK648_11680 [Pseudomonas poae]|uniref:Uncharacterized protein n=1 Tax=Pseudomonas poae TaxID=200451 RepID=A0A423F5B6_9PSED|nr:hypothetical protein [Pseudomonas poae]ROM49848.1 hypothetical protein BK648_11680 [Pseudomonas poae]